tara:strand:- start:220 stop:741 length:522 start_codon:yes stop_codon:yes gene_type:complete
MSILKVNSIIPTAGVATGGGGGIIQIRQVVKTDTFSINSTTYTDITGLSQSINFTSGHKILVIFDGGAGYENSDQMVNIRLCDSSGVISGAVGDSSGSRTQATTAIRGQQNANIEAVNFTYLDSPSGTSETYKVQMRSANSGNTSFLNRSGADDNASYRSRVISTLTLIEVSA